MGGDHGMQKSPIVERWATMRETTVQHFRFTPRTTGISFLLMVAIPVGIYALTSLELKKQDEVSGQKRRFFPF
ncbi:hypothetical protein CAOG_01484 [Capsaspora owczarzaki ATCC 30864]|uniref:NADH-ubiquinone oxidoreductase B15 subunit n=1 Tax=Capsaspora owczarzaki (strain ATCC 30864) TaxID=595528 RepID=A0A0D2WJE4_CAPO3|nr:hypothetical protein CAOG_01484 [Capsaspora owczarzaki ATCC 30864]KJE90135.1 hypothetical protein CAOG_001484 [Capsaspora owczarzaki ATCC 30864]|eukprot:XP_004364352.1 hypothetical protein CAOG_01484 [Capsaspora owczarzaki ATCC 30864]